MVKLLVKSGDKNLFLYETQSSIRIGVLLHDLVDIFNGRLKIERLCYEVDDLAKHGVTLPPDMQGLSPDQIADFIFKNEWVETNLTPDNYVIRPDPIGKRNGFAPLEKVADILTKTTAEAKARISQKLVDSDVCTTLDEVQNTLQILRGAVSICYPMGLPSYEIIKLELDGKEDLSGTQASKRVLEHGKTNLWWANKQLDSTKLLSDYVGKNEKTKLVVKLQKIGCGAPSREPGMSEQQKKDLMLAEFRRREALKALEEDDDDFHLNSQWADNNHLKKTFLGLNTIRFK